MNDAGPAADTVPWEIPAVLLVDDGVRLEAGFAAAVRAFGALSPHERRAAETRFAFQQMDGRIRAEAINKYLALLSQIDGPCFSKA